jgi:hypothetical protein
MAFTISQRSRSRGLARPHRFSSLWIRSKGASYKLLFATWGRDATLLSHVRNGLRVVAARVPDTGRKQYLERLRDHASALFTEHIYEETDDGAEGEDVAERFNFDISGENAPHRPVLVYSECEFQDWDPTAAAATVTSEQERGAFGSLV